MANGEKKLDNKNVSVPMEDVLELMQNRIAKRVRENVEAELRRRYFWIGLIAAAITSGLVTLIVRNQMIDSLVRLEAAETVQLRASDRLSEAAERSEESLARANESLGKVADAATQLEALDSRTDDLVQRITDASKTNLELSSSITVDVDRLAALLGKVVERQDQDDAEREQLANQVLAVRESLTGSGQEIASEIERAGRSKYKLALHPTKPVPMTELSEELSVLGFNVGIDRASLGRVFEARVVLLVLAIDVDDDVARLILSTTLKYIRLPVKVYKLDAGKYLFSVHVAPSVPTGSLPYVKALEISQSTSPGVISQLLNAQN